MNSTLMRKSQRSGDSIWSLPAQSSRTLRVGPGPRVLQVQEGRIWLTTAGTAGDYPRERAEGHRAAFETALADPEMDPALRNLAPQL